MWIFLIFVGLILFAVALVLVRFNQPKKFSYQYLRRQSIMTPSEQEFFNILMSVVGDKFYIFPQVHLSTLLNHEVKGQNWLGAFRHISQKSVDYVLCDKSFLSPKLVIELDDWSHKREDRLLRDDEVNRILIQAKLPFLRVKNYKDLSSEELLRRINESVLS